MFDRDQQPAPLNSRAHEFAEIARKSYNQLRNGERINSAIYTVPALITAVAVDGPSPYRAIGAGAATLGVYAFRRAVRWVSPFFKDTSFIAMATDVGKEIAEEAVKNYAPDEIYDADPTSKERVKWLKQNLLLMSMITTAQYRVGSEKIKQANTKTSFKAGCITSLVGLAKMPAQIYTGYKVGTFVGNVAAHQLNSPTPPAINPQKLKVVSAKPV